MRFICLIKEQIKLNVAATKVENDYKDFGYDNMESAYENMTITTDSTKDLDHHGSVHNVGYVLDIELSMPSVPCPTFFFFLVRILDAMISTM